MSNAARHLFRLIGKRDENGLWSLDDDERAHLCLVLRPFPGYEFELTDGKGFWASAVVSELGKGKGKNKSIFFKITSEEFVPQGSCPYSIGLGAVKPSTLQEVVPELVELGVDRIDVFSSRGAEKRRTDKDLLTKCQRIAQQSTKLAKRCYFPRIAFHDSLEELLIDYSQVDGFKGFASPFSVRTLMEADTIGQGGSMIVGGEKGLSDDEIALLGEHHFEGFSLGRYVLRSRTAVLAVATFMSMNQFQGGS